MQAVKYIWIFVLVLDYFLPNKAEERSGFELHSITDYVVFSGDVYVTYVLPSNTTLSRAVIELVEMSSLDLIRRLELPTQISSSGQLNYVCGLLDKPGRYLFRMLNRRDGDVLAESEPLDVRWPNIQMQLPPEHETSTGSVAMSFGVAEQLQCKSINQSVEYKFEVLRFNDFNDQSKYSLMYNFTVPDFLIHRGNSINLNCNIFDEAGYYQVGLKSNRDPINAMARSNTMDVTWNSRYAVSVIPKSILPCETEFKVQYEQPSCAGSEDKIRLFIQRPTDTPGAYAMVYVSEVRALTTKWESSFNCDVFDRSETGYCFSYISIARSGATEKQYEICVPTNDTPDPVVNGGWSEWANWSECSSSCEDGTRARYRLCDDPEPSGGGMRCVGENSEQELCGTICKVPSTPAPVYTPDPNCPCGCQVATSRGQIVGSSSCRGSSVWVISAPRDHIVSLTFKEYSLDKTNAGTQISVRDGGTRQSELLIRDNGENPPTKVETSQNKLWLEFEAYETSDGLYGEPRERFAATFVTYLNNRTAGGYGQDEGWSMVTTTMILIGVLICIIIIVAAVGFICYHHYSQKNRNKKQHQANQALLVNGEPPNSPAHSQSGSTIKGSANLSFGDPVSSPTRHSKKRDYIVAKSEPTTPVKVNDIDIRIKENKKGSPSKTKHSKQRLSKSYTNGLSSHVNKDNDTSAQVPVTQQQASPTYVNSSQGYNPTQHSRNQAPNSNKPLSPRNDKRNKSFISAVERGPQGVPMADAEDLSPTTPTNQNMYPYRQTQAGESIPMESYYSAHPKQYHSGKMAETPLYEKRPPVEGRDSITRKKSRDDVREQVNTPSHMPLSPTKRNTNYVPPITHRPDVKPLPLRSIQRPDGQSPDSKQMEMDTYSPTSQHSTGLSPVLQKTQLFPSRTPSHLDLPVDPDFEYDDSIYVPDLPGSYFNMDPNAYTLTWQQHPSWQGKGAGQRTESQQTINSNNNGSFC